MSGERSASSSSLYGSLRPFDRVSDLPRLPRELPRPRQNPVLVQAAPVEMIHIAQRFPTAFRRLGDRIDIVAVTGLIPLQRQLLAPGDPARGILPILLQTYPFAVVDDGEQGQVPILIDETALALGAVARGDDERTALEAVVERQCQALWAFVQSRRAAQPILDALDRVAAFRRWDLAFKREGVSFGIGGLSYIDWEFFGTDDHRAVVAEHGLAAAELITAHRISQHRMNDMLYALAHEAGVGPQG